MRPGLICLFCLGFIACLQEKSNDIAFRKEGPVRRHPIAAAANKLTKGPYVKYDPAYKSIPYPNGDVAPDRGVCADVVVRALRSCRLPGDSACIDLQQKVHADMSNNFREYPRCWGLSAPDPNIDHRRVPNLMTFFERQGKSISIDDESGNYHPGDIVAWQLNDGRPHIGIVVDGHASNGWPLVVHNIGYGQEKANVLFSWKIIGHYRLFEN